MSLSPDKPTFRYLVLLVNCLLTAGSYYCFDQPSVLENQIEQQVIAGFTSDVSTYYNLYYTAYSWSNMVMSLFAGVLVDRLGTKRCAFIFLSMCLVGQCLFATGPMLHSAAPKTRYLVMFAGRLLFGLGGGSITIVQNTISASYFKGKEIAMAFGFTLTVSRLGSVVNFDLTSFLYKEFDRKWPGYGLSAALWFGAILVALSMLAAASFWMLDGIAERLEERAEVAINDGSPKKKKTRAPMRLKDVFELPGVFWVVCLIIVAFYNMVFPFLADAKDYFQSSKYGYSPTAAGVRAGIVYTCSMVVSPFLGRAVDWFGRRGHLALFGTLLTLPTFLLFAETSVDPFVPMFMLGIAYSVCAAALWPSIQLLVELRVVGTANGLATALQMLGIGLCNIAVGALKDKSGEEAMIWLFVGMAVLATALSLWLLVLDRKRKVMYLGQRDKVLADASEKTALLDVTKADTEA